jgi:hypothetical protein
VVELAADGTEAGFNVAKTLTVSQLSECHRQILIPTGQIFQIATTAISIYALLELLVGKELDQLREDGAPSVHPALSMFRTRPPRMQGRSKTSFSFQIVFTPNCMHHIESIWLARSPRKFPRTAVTSQQ